MSTWGRIPTAKLMAMITMSVNRAAAYNAKEKKKKWLKTVQCIKSLCEILVYFAERLSLTTNLIGINSPVG